MNYAKNLNKKEREVFEEKILKRLHNTVKYYEEFIQKTLDDYNIELNDQEKENLLNSYILNEEALLRVGYRYMLDYRRYKVLHNTNEEHKVSRRKVASSFCHWFYMEKPISYPNEEIINKIKSSFLILHSGAENKDEKVEKLLRYLENPSLGLAYSIVDYLYRNDKELKSHDRSKPPFIKKHKDVWEIIVYSLITGAYSNSQAEGCFYYIFKDE